MKPSKAVKFAGFDDEAADGFEFVHEDEQEHVQSSNDDTVEFI